MKRIFLTIIFILFSINVQAATWYVATTGNDTTGDGTTGNRWATPQKCIDQIPQPVTEAYTCIIGDGTYTDTNNYNNGYGGYIISIDKDGTAAYQITIKAENQYGAILDGQLTHVTAVTWSAYSGNIKQVTTSNQVNYISFGLICPSSGCTNEGLNHSPQRKGSLGAVTTARDWYYDGAATVYYHTPSSTQNYYTTDGTGRGISCSGCSYVKIEGFDIKNIKQTGLAFGNASNIHILKNKIHDVARWSMYCTQAGRNYGHDGIGTDHLSDEFIIERNIIYNIGRVEGGCADSDYSIDHGIYAYGDNHDIQNNLFYNCKAGWPIQAQGVDNAGTPEMDKITGWNIFNNTFYGKNPQRDGHIILIANDHDFRIENNISYIPGAYFIHNSYGGSYTYMGRDSVSVPIDSGTGTGSANLFTDNTKVWVVDTWVRAGSYPWKLKDSNGTLFSITDNTATTLTISGTPASGAYSIVGNNLVKNNLVYDETNVRIATYSDVTSPVTSYMSFANNTVGSTSDPQFASVVGSDFHLLSNSPAINAGNDVGLTSDLEGTAYVGNPDLGAYESTYASGDVTAPSIPGSVTATAQGSTSIAVDWADSTDAVQVIGYEVWRCSGVSCSDYGASALATAMVSNYVDSAVAANTSYSYKIKAYDAVPNTSAFSSTATVVTGTTPPTSENIVYNPGFEVAGLSPWIGYSNGSAALTQETTLMHSGSGAAKYVITTAGTNVQVYQYGLILAPNTAYTLTFWAYSSTGIDVRTQLIKHTSPYTNYGVSTVSNLTSGWAEYTVVFTTTGFASQVNDGRLSFQFHDYDVALATYYIDDVSITKYASEVVNSPTGLSAADVDSDNGGAIVLNWTVSDTAGVTKQHIYRSTGGAYTLVQTISNNTTATYTDSGLTNGTTYYYVLKAEKSGTFSVNSASVNAVPSSQQNPVDPTVRSIVTRSKATRPQATRGTAVRP